MAWVLEADHTLTPTMLAEFEDMVVRHPDHFFPPVIHLTVQSDRPNVDRSMGTNVEQWRELVAAYFPPDLVSTALCVIRYESGGNPDAKNPRSTARGLFQILASLWAPHFGVSYQDLYNPELNVRLAYKIYLSQGWGAWTVYPLCR